MRTSDFNFQESQNCRKTFLSVYHTHKIKHVGGLISVFLASNFSINLFLLEFLLKLHEIKNVTLMYIIDISFPVTMTEIFLQTFYDKEEDVKSSNCE